MWCVKTQCPEWVVKGTQQMYGHRDRDGSFSSAVTPADTDPAVACLGGGVTQPIRRRTPVETCSGAGRKPPVIKVMRTFLLCTTGQEGKQSLKSVSPLLLEKQSNYLRKGHLVHFIRSAQLMQQKPQNRTRLGTTVPKDCMLCVARQTLNQNLPLEGPWTLAKFGSRSDRRN